jgi:hypothetical protein
MQSSEGSDITMIEWIFTIAFLHFLLQQVGHQKREHEHDMAHVHSANFAGDFASGSEAC